MDERRMSNFKLALRSIKCDFDASLKGWNILLALFLLVTPLIPLGKDGSKAFLLLCGGWGNVARIYIWRFTPQCKRIYYILPLTAKDRMSIMKWRVHVTEVIIIIYTMFIVGIQMLVMKNQNIEMQIGVALVLFSIFEVMTAQLFARYRKIKNMKSVVISWIVAISVTVIVVTLCINEVINEVWLVTIVFTLMGVRWYFSNKADFTEYRYVESMDSAIVARHRKEEEAV